MYDQVTVDLLGLTLIETRQSQQNLFTILNYFLSLIPHYEIVDYIYNVKVTHKDCAVDLDDDRSEEKDHVTRQFNQRILYNLRTLVHVIFDHDSQIQEYNKRRT